MKLTNILTRRLSFCGFWAALLGLTAVLNFAVAVRLARADEPHESASGEQSDEAALAGHSAHGEVFNEGPRQATYLMPGMGHVDFPITANDDLVQRLFNQGVAQLHGFWYYEAERTFRQASVLDPECAMCYWGMTMANVSNQERARKFIAEAVKRKEGASQRERLFIDALNTYCRDKDKDGKKIAKKDRSQRYTRDLEKIVLDFPEDIEAKAFFALQLWENDRNELPIVSHVAIDAVLQQVFGADPMHPAHHYRIHLWDGTRPQKALESAARCGQSLPGIAHMWHMPGHTYSKLHRYHDAVWQQEASARVDHAHMIRDRVLPDQIHNFAHNNEWLIRNLVKIGRVQDALNLATNMLELPRHPKFNTLEKGSAKYGRERLILVLSSYRLWPELISLAQTVYLEPTDKQALQIERLRHLGIALALSQQAAPAEAVRQDIADRLASCTADQTAEEASLKAFAAAPQEKVSDNAQEKTADAVSASAATDNAEKEVAKEPVAQGADQPADQPVAKAAGGETADQEPPKAPNLEEPESRTAEPKQRTAEEQKKADEDRKRRQRDSEGKIKELKERKTKLEEASAAVEAAQAAARKDWSVALQKFDKAGTWDKLLKAEWLAESGEIEKAIEIVDKEHNAAPGEILPLAVKAWIYWNAANTESAKEPFQLLRGLSGTSDLNTPLLARLNPLAVECGSGEQWRTPYEPANDTGVRPPLDTLGPFRWHPADAPSLEVQKPDGQPVSLAAGGGKPTVVIFYLGFGCLHCMEQLQEFSPRVQQFREAGLEIVAISSENAASLTTGLENYPEKIDIPLHADPELTAFKAYRCYDDFEEQPLHGTFLLGTDGRILWQDINFEPFKNVDFLINESRRLLEIAGSKNSVQPEKQIAKLEETTP